MMRMELRGVFLFQQTGQWMRERRSGVFHSVLPSSYAMFLNQINLASDTWYVSTGNKRQLSSATMLKEVMDDELHDWSVISGISRRSDRDLKDSCRMSM